MYPLITLAGVVKTIVIGYVAYQSLKESYAEWQEAKRPPAPQPPPAPPKPLKPLIERTVHEIYSLMGFAEASAEQLAGVQRTIVKNGDDIFDAICVENIRFYVNKQYKLVACTAGDDNRQVDIVTHMLDDDEIKTIVLIMKALSVF